MKEETKKDNSLLKNSISGLQFGILQQLISRILTFVLNVLIVREVSAEIIGISNVQFQLVINTILMLTRECFRRAALRQKFDKSAPEEFKKNISMTYWSIPVGLVGCYLVGKFFEKTVSLEEKGVGDFVSSMWITVWSVMFEILAEPMAILVQNLMLSRVRFFMESSSVMINCGLTYVMVHFFQMGLLSFAYARLVSTVYIFVAYYAYFLYQISTGRAKQFNLNKPIDIFPSFSNLFDVKSKFHILGVIWTQSILKLVLGEGEKYILKFKESLLDQGIYSIVTNLASLVPRILFAPIEEIAHTYFAKLVDNSSKLDNPHFKKEKIGTAISVFNSLVKLMVFFGLFLAVFGPPFSFFLLDFLYTFKVSMTDAPFVLSFYCVYVLTIAVNGVTEAFVHAVGTAKELNFFNLMMFFFSSAYILCAFIFITYFKTIGLIIANCINMFLRITFSLNFTKKFFERNSEIIQQKINWNWKQVLPKKIIWVSFLVFFFVCKYTEQSFCSQVLIGKSGVLRSSACFGHVGVGAICFFAAMFLIYQFERDWLNNLRNIWKSKND